MVWVGIVWITPSPIDALPSPPRASASATLMSWPSVSTTIEQRTTSTSRRASPPYSVAIFSSQRARLSAEAREHFVHLPESGLQLLATTAALS